MYWFWRFISVHLLVEWQLTLFDQSVIGFVTCLEEWRLLTGPERKTWREVSERDVLSHLGGEGKK